jgi:glutamate N-acetyltransferase/amino-acid N-acetyltransferase
MSTNDTVIILANGAAKNKPIESGSKEEDIFVQALSAVCVALAQKIVRDAEGITKFIEINVTGAVTDTQAQALAFSVANSNLFKCAMFGSDPNWGRIAAALGSVPSDLSWEKMEITLNKRPVFKNSKPIKVENNKFLRGKDVRVDINLHQGVSKKTVYTSDLSYGYVRINADYN